MGEINVEQLSKENLSLDINVTSQNGRPYLESLINKPMKLVISDGRILIGQFLCTDREQNVILGSCQEYIGNNDSGEIEDPRLLGLAMVPGRHIQSMYIDMDRHLLEELRQLKNDANTPAEVTPTFDDSVTMGDETSEIKDEREEAIVK